MGLKERDLTGLMFGLTQPHPQVALLDVTSNGHQEFFGVAEGERTLVITVLDVTNAGYTEPRVYVVEKPLGWQTPGQAEELLLAIWNTLSSA